MEFLHSYIFLFSCLLDRYVSAYFVSGVTGKCLSMSETDSDIEVIDLDPDTNSVRIITGQRGVKLNLANLTIPVNASTSTCACVPAITYNHTSFVINSRTAQFRNVNKTASFGGFSAKASFPGSSSSSSGTTNNSSASGRAGFRDYSNVSAGFRNSSTTARQGSSVSTSANASYTASASDNNKIYFIVQTRQKDQERIHWLTNPGFTVKDREITDVQLGDTRFTAEEMFELLVKNIKTFSTSKFWRILDWVKVSENYKSFFGYVESNNLRGLPFVHDFVDKEFSRSFRNTLSDEIKRKPARHHIYTLLNEIIRKAVFDKYDLLKLSITTLSPETKERLILDMLMQIDDARLAKFIGKFDDIIWNGPLKIESRAVSLSLANKHTSESNIKVKD